MTYMARLTHSQTHELSASVASFRSGQREQFMARWRRSVMLGVLPLVVLGLIRMLATI